MRLPPTGGQAGGKRTMAQGNDALVMLDPQLGPCGLKPRLLPVVGAWREIAPNRLQLFFYSMV